MSVTGMLARNFQYSRKHLLCRRLMRSEVQGVLAGTDVLYYMLLLGGIRIFPALILRFS
jgi:hypothetical protein